MTWEVEASAEQSSILGEVLSCLWEKDPLTKERLISLLIRWLKLHLHQGVYLVAILLTHAPPFHCRIGSAVAVRPGMYLAKVAVEGFGS